MKTEKIFSENGKLYEFDYIDYLDFQIKLLSGKITGIFYIENEHGGKDLIDEFGCVKHYRPFNIVNKRLHEIITLQINKRIEQRDDK